MARTGVLTAEVLAGRVAEVEAVDQDAEPLAAERDARRGERPRILDLGRAQHLLVPARERLADRRGGADHVDHDARRRRGRLVGSEGDMNVHAATLAVHVRRCPTATAIPTGRRSSRAPSAAGRSAGLHELRACRDPLPGSCERRARRRARPGPRARCRARAQTRWTRPGHDRADRDQRRSSTSITAGPGKRDRQPWRAALRRHGRSTGLRSATGTGGGSSPRCSCTRACSTSRSTCSRSGGSAPSSSRRSGRRRFLLLYFVSGHRRLRRARCCSAPRSPSPSGASGAIFGLIGALLILEYRATGTLAGQVLTLIVLNIAFTFADPRHLEGRPSRWPRRRHRRDARARCGTRRRRRRALGLALAVGVGGRQHLRRLRPGRCDSLTLRYVRRAGAGRRHGTWATGRTTSATPSIRDHFDRRPLRDRLLVLGPRAPVLGADPDLARARRVRARSRSRRSPACRARSVRSTPPTASASSSAAAAFA